MSLRLLARGSLFYTAGNLLPRIGAFLLLPLLTRVLERSEFGAVSLMASLALLLSIAYRLGLDGALLRLHVALEGREHPELYATVAALMAAAIAGGTLVMVAAGAWLLDGTLLGVPLVPHGLLALAIGGLMTLHGIPSVFLRATDRPGRYLALALGSFTALAVATILLVVVAGLGAAGALLGQLAGAIFVGAAALAVLLGLRPWRLSRALGRRALGLGLPLLPSTVAGWLLNVSDRLLIGLLIGLSATQALAAIGVYSLGYQLGYAIGLVAISFNAAWLPFFYRVGETPRGPGVLREMTSLVVAGFAALAGALALLAPWLVAVVAPPAWSDAADVAAVAGFASVANAAALMIAGVFTLTQRTRPLALLTLAAAAVNIAANVVLVPRLGIVGAAWASLAAYVALAGLSWLAAASRYPLALDAWRLVAAVGATGGLALVGRLLRDAAGPMSTVATVGLLAAMVIVALLLVRTPAARLRGLVATAGAPGASDRMGVPKEVA